MKPITTALAAVLAVIAIGTQVNAIPLTLSYTQSATLQTKTSKTATQYIQELGLTPVTVCVQIDDSCIDIGSGAIHNESKTLLTAKHVLLGEDWFRINGLRISSNKVSFKVKSNGKIIQNLSFNQAALPASQFQQGINGVGKDLAVMFYKESQLDILKESVKSWNLPKTESELNLLMVQSALNQGVDISPSLFSYRTRDSLGDLVFDSELHTMNMKFTGAKLSAYEDVIFGNEFISVEDGQIVLRSYNSASGQEAFQGFTLPYGQNVKDNIEGLIKNTNGVNPTGPGTSGSVVVGKVDSRLLLGAFVAMNGAEVDINQAAIGVLSTPKLAKDYIDLGSSVQLEELAIYRSLFPPSAVMVWTLADFESL